MNGSLPSREDDRLVFGADFDWHTFKSNAYLPNSKSISTQAPYANYTMRLEEWDFIPGFRYDHNEYFGSQASPSFGTIYHVPYFENTDLRFKISRAFNAPPLLWIYNTDPDQGVLPNPDLKAERAMVYEAGVSTKVFRRMDLGLNVYRSDVKDAIDTVCDDLDMCWKQNFKKVERKGVDLTLKYKLSEYLTLTASGAFNDVINIEPREIVRDQDIARQSFRLGMDFDNGNGLRVAIFGRYDRWSSPASLAPNDRKFIFDARFSKEWKNVYHAVDLEIFLNLYNLTNSKYWSSKTFPLPKRYFEGGLKASF